MAKKRFDGWLIVSVLLLLLFVAVLIYPMFGVIKQAVIMPDGSFSWEQFEKFFGSSYYVDTIYNSFKITIFVTLLTLVIGIPFAYFYAFYKLKGAKILFVVSIFVILNTIKLAVYARREEISIMRYVGATKTFISLPFLFEGIIIGLLSGVIAYLLQTYMYNYVQKMIISDVQMISILPFAQLRAYVILGFIAVGVITGVLGSELSMRKYLKA